MSDSNEELEKAKFFFNYSMSINSLILQGKTRLYNKIKDLTTVITALITILFGLGYYCLDNLYFKPMLFPLWLTLLCLCIAVLIGFYILWINQFNIIDPLTLLQSYEQEDLQFITLITASSVAKVANINREEHNNMGDRYQLMIGFVSAGLIILLGTFLFAISTA